jgi:hypothetical protein
LRRLPLSCRPALPPPRRLDIIFKGIIV